MPIQISRAIYSPTKGISNEIPPKQVKQLYTNDRFRVDVLISRIASDYFGLDQNSEYQISVKRDIITLTMFDGNGNKTNEVHTLDIQQGKINLHQQTATKIRAANVAKLAVDASTIIERVKAVWAKKTDRTDSGAFKISGNHRQKKRGIRRQAQPRSGSHSSSPTSDSDNEAEKLQERIRELRRQHSKLTEDLQKATLAAQQHRTNVSTPIDLTSHLAALESD